MNTIYCVVSDAGLSVHYTEAAAVCRAEYLTSKTGKQAEVYAFDMRTGRHVVTVSEAVGQEVAA